MKTGRYSLKELLTHNEIDQIIVPEIQRDYVWQADNVTKLIDDIVRKFEKKEKQILEITVNGKIENNVSVSNFLIREYERLKYKQKLGFIYAYHDRDYAGKFFLIDGQQRITTLFLLLVYLYKELGVRSSEFMQLYFIDSKLKLDYKVREQSHDFLHLFVKSEISHCNYVDSINFYQEYLKDITIANIISNYNQIAKLLHGYENKEGLLEFLEDFVEVNYFDTHLSDQGEQLYIYMNSRGEQLSHQEILRAELMKKIEDADTKIEMGSLWEEWQNFFWQKRGNNENADVGFEEFLKWATILHLISNKEVVLNTFLDDDNSYSQKELKEHYIKEFKDKTQSRLQKEKIFSYQIHYLDFDYLRKIFISLKLLFNLDSHFIPKDLKWLSGYIIKLDYAYLLPLLQYINQISPDQTENELENIERVAMFLKNLSYFEHVTKNPDSSTVELVQMISFLKNDNHDLVQLLTLTTGDLSGSLFTINEKEKLRLFTSNIKDRRAWEEFYWKVSLQEDFSQFIMGDSTVLFNCYAYVNKQISVGEQIDELSEYFDIIFNVFFKNYSKDIVRLLVLSKYDYLIRKGTGNNIDKYSFITSNLSYEARREWKELFIDTNFVELLQWIKEKNIKDVERLYELATKEFVITDYRKSFLENPLLLKYCGHKKILWQNEYRILLLNQTNYSVSNSREIQVALLKLQFLNQKAWVHENNCCVFDFIYDDESGQIIHVDKLKGVYALDIVYDPNNFTWTFTLFSRKCNITEKFNNVLSSNWKIVSDRITLQNSAIPNFDDNESLVTNNMITAKAVKAVFEKTTQLFKRINK